MPTIIPETGQAGVHANCYTTLDEANAYHDERLHTDAWTTATEDDRIRALIMATRVIDGEIEWAGFRVSVAQALEWPRYQVPRKDMQGWSSFPLQRNIGGEDYWPSDAVPDRVKQATAELARLLLETDRTADDPAKGVQSLKLGQNAIDLEFAAKDRIEPLNPFIRNLLEPFGQDRSNRGVVTVRRA